MKPTTLDFNYREWGRTLQQVKIDGMTIELLDDLILHFMLFFSVEHCSSEYSHEIREKSLPLIAFYANRYGLTKDIKDSVEFERLCSIVAGASNITVCSDAPEMKMFRAKLLEVRMALDRDEEIPISEQKSHGKHFGKFPTPPDSVWEDVRMTFKDAETVYVNIKGAKKTLAFYQMGMAKHGNKSSIQWTLLHAFSMKPSGLPLKKSHKAQIQRLRKSLKDFFEITDDPFTKTDGLYKLKIQFPGTYKVDDTPADNDIGQLIVEKFRRGESIRSARNAFTEIDDET